MPFPWQAWVLRQWQTRNWVSAVLWPFSGLTWLVVSWRRLQRRRHLTLSPGVPVVVVGNVMVGGAGKTPLVMALAMHWQSQGIQVGVVARGFGRIATQITAVNEHSHLKMWATSLCWFGAAARCRFLWVQTVRLAAGP
jgi:tetraacyldisaccharide 4'-kinase